MLLILMSAAACSYSPDQDSLAFESAWMRAIPPGARMTAAFGTLVNPGPEPVQIESITSPSFGSVSLHRTEIVDGISKMREVEPVEIGAESRLVLEPGGYHLMLMMPDANLQEGQAVILNMALADGRHFAFQVPVEKR